jgi:hypothetical protein
VKGFVYGWVNDLMIGIVSERLGDSVINRVI